MWLGYSFPQAFFHSDFQVAGKVGHRDIGTKILGSICIFERILIVETMYKKENDRKGKLKQLVMVKLCWIFILATEINCLE